MSEERQSKSDSFLLQALRGVKWSLAIIGATLLALFLVQPELFTGTWVTQQILYDFVSFGAVKWRKIRAPSQFTSSRRQ